MTYPKIKKVDYRAGDTVSIQQPGVYGVQPPPLVGVVQSVAADGSVILEPKDGGVSRFGYASGMKDVITVTAYGPDSSGSAVADLINDQYAAEGRRTPLPRVGDRVRVYPRVFEAQVIDTRSDGSLLVRAPGKGPETVHADTPYEVVKLRAEDVPVGTQWERPEDGRRYVKVRTDWWVSIREVEKDFSDVGGWRNKLVDQFAQPLGAER